MVRLLGEVTEGTGVEAGSVTLTTFPGPGVRVRHHPARRRPRANVEVPVFAVRRVGDDALRWKLAHEVAHITYGDLDLRPRLASSSMTLARVLGAVVAFDVLGCLLLVAVFRAWGTGLAVVVPSVAVYVLLNVVLFAAFMRRSDVVLRSRRAAQRARVNELRCDLVATQRYGLHAGAEAIMLLSEWDDRPEVRRLLGSYSSHPPAEVRLEAIKAYDPRLDPQVEAARLLPLLAAKDSTRA